MVTPFQRKADLKVRLYEVRLYGRANARYSPE